MKKPKFHRGLIQLAIFVTFLGLMGHFTKTSESASMSNVSVTMDNSRLSFRGALGSGNSEGSTIAIINTSSYASRDTAQLVEGDQITIHTSGIAANGAYTIAEVPASDRVNLTTDLGTGDADAGDDVISTQSSTLTTAFTTTSAVANGSFRILVPAHSTDATSADGLPDEGAFDMNDALNAPTVTCPADVGTDYVFGSATAVASSVTINGTDYHAFECPYTGPGAINTDFDGLTNDPIVIDSLINPAPTGGSHTVGTADTYLVIVQNLDATDAVIDQTTTSVGVIEAVRVTATIDPQIAFQITGNAAATTRCGFASDVTTTAAAVPFGSLDLNGFIDASQNLRVSTNALNGFVVTATANDQLGRNGGSCTGAEGTDVSDENVCIQDSLGNDGASMTPSVEEDWTEIADKGFAFSIEDVDTDTTEAFAYNSTTTGSCTAGTFCARQFADASAAEDPQAIFSNTTVADSHDVDVCYRIIPAVTDAAGKYENYIIYTATATF